MAHNLSPAQRIRAAKEQLGNALYLLGHHYQNDAVIQHMDIVGDSLELARKIPGAHSRYIVFCGVFFMAEAAAILAKLEQEVYTPAMDAKCIMSEMAPARLVEDVLVRLQSRGRSIVPLAYVNSSAAVKALCGRFGGAVCTSANAATMLAWARKQGDAVLFLPDKNLGQNTADALGLQPAARLVLDIRDHGQHFDLDAAQKAALLLWPGCCAIHNNRFKTAHIAALRVATPGARVVVHPECQPDLVAAADAAGSTSFIIRYAAEAPGGATVAIGTEINLVQRLAAKYSGQKTIIPLAPSACSNMAKTTEENLAVLLEGIAAINAGGSAQLAAVRVAPNIAAPARVALQRMLDACA